MFPFEGSNERPFREKKISRTPFLSLQFRHDRIVKVPRQSYLELQTSREFRRNKIRKFFFEHVRFLFLIKFHEKHPRQTKRCSDRILNQTNATE